ncbi:MAG: hydrogenase nickel incorporation protein HypB [Dissulfurispiraceae bacterium]|jgi:hydrogenase nickel incorporation protein HypB
MKLKLADKILTANERIAEGNRKFFDELGIFVINLISSPGAGKTTLLETTIKALGNDAKLGVIEGDIMGTDDAERIDRLGVPVVQINTGGACHLDAGMISDVLGELPLASMRLLFIENVGNLVCPAEFKLGEDIKVAILSITEGHDKPLKYPIVFQESKALLISKIDLKPVLDVDVEKIKRDARSLNPAIEIFEISSKTGEGIGQWVQWINTLIS